MHNKTVKISQKRNANCLQRKKMPKSLRQNRFLSFCFGHSLIMTPLILESIRSLFSLEKGYKLYQTDWEKIVAWGILDRSSSQVRDRFRRLMKQQQQQQPQPQPQPPNVTVLPQTGTPIQTSLPQPPPQSTLLIQPNVPAPPQSPSIQQPQSSAVGSPPLTSNNPTTTLSVITPLSNSTNTPPLSSDTKRKLTQVFLHNIKTD
jgi:hypothetical protein